MESFLDESSTRSSAEIKTGLRFKYFTKSIILLEAFIALKKWKRFLCLAETCVETEVPSVLTPVVVSEDDEVLPAAALHPELGYVLLILRSSQFSLHHPLLTSANLH